MNHSPLDAVHRRSGAKLVDFGSWEMPLAYPTGTLAEHQACRSSAAIFDVSHLGTLKVSGPDALDVLQRCFTNDLMRIAPGRAQYTHLLDPDTASVVDDIIVWWMAPDEFEVIPNASNSPQVQSVLRDMLGGSADAQMVDTTATRAMVAIQGPRARSILAGISDEAAAVARFRVASFVFEGEECTAAGTGYTGEDGVECAVPAGVAESFWDAIVQAGAVPAGLGARDTLRLEAGFPLHGHELGNGITTLQAGLEWVVSWDKGDFLGRSALAEQKADGGYRVMRGLSTEGRRPPREGQDVLFRGTGVGTVTSGNFSPTLGHGIALALLDQSIEPEAQVEIDVRGKPMPAMVVELPFYRPG